MAYKKTLQFLQLQQEQYKQHLRVNQLVVSGSFEGLRGELYTPAAGGDHIHRAIAGRNGGIELPLTAVLSDGNTAGQYLAC